jgi:hypothetical protein
METVNYKGYNIEIKSDDCPLNPRTDWDNGSIMVCQHNRYSLGDEEHGVDLSDCESWADVKQAIIDQKKPIAILPLYLYDHSGITMNTTGFSCNWDSGQVGFIFVDEETATKIGWTKEYAEKLAKGDDENYAGKTREEILTDFMVSDVQVYDDYISGQVYRFEITDEDGEEVEDGSCGGFFGYDNEKSGLLDHAQSTIDAEINWKIKQRISKLKELIKAKVPVIYRTLPSL